MQITAGSIYCLKPTFGGKPYFAVPLPTGGEMVRFKLYNQLTRKSFGQNAYECSAADFSKYFDRNANMGDRQMISGPYGKFDVFDAAVIKLTQRV